MVVMIVMMVITMVILMVIMMVVIMMLLMVVMVMIMINGRGVICIDRKPLYLHVFIRWIEWKLRDYIKNYDYIRN
jgi:hypothetical protein